jgi:hypothetical protein
MLYTIYGNSAPLRKTGDESIIFHHPKELNNYSGIVELPYYNDTLEENIYFFFFFSLKPIELNASNFSDCLMEINFRITHSVEVGMIAHSSISSVADRQIPLANLTGYDDINSKDNVWRKVYVNFTQDIFSDGQMKNFDIYIRATIKENEKNARFLFDNIKIVYQ